MSASPTPSGRSSLQVAWPGDARQQSDSPGPDTFWPPPPPLPLPPPPPRGPGAGAGSVYPHWSGSDPRSSSAQSLTPSDGPGSREPRQPRTLLLVYIHGFMGNDSSFRSFPAHVHQYLKYALADSHAVHSKIYPRYKTYKAIDVARDNFSRWLEPHESDTTDVILIGHSMGGLLAAEVVLMPAENPQSGYPFKHRILGSLSLDSPFLGLHPGIIVTGIASLFRKSPDASPDPQGEHSPALPSPNPSGSLSPDPSLYNDLMAAPPAGTMSPTGTSISSASSTPAPAPAAGDPYFNPPFYNDVQFRDRGWFRNLAHFAKKYQSEGIMAAARKHIVNHLEFGACLMDFPGLNQRYERLRRLEDVDDFNLSSGQGGYPPRRQDAQVRFVNYYTLSTGRERSPTRPRGPAEASSSSSTPTVQTSTESDVHLKPDAASLSGSGSQRSSFETASEGSTPRISIEDPSGGKAEVLPAAAASPPPPYWERDTLELAGSDLEGSDAEADLTVLAPIPIEEALEELAIDSAQEPVSATTSTPSLGNDGPSSPSSPPLPPLTEAPSLPPIPDLPPPPTPPNLDGVLDKDVRKQAEREAKRAQKEYDQAAKNRDRAVRERDKLLEARRRKAAKEAERRAKEEEKRRRREGQEEKKAAQRRAKEEEQRRREVRKAEEAEGQELAMALQREAEAAQRGEERMQRAREQEQREREAEARRLEQEARERPSGLGKEEEREKEASTSTSTSTSVSEKKEKETEKKKKDRKFCTLPPKKGPDGARDRAWVPVRMEGVDEVGAHCGIFLPGPHYEMLLGDVGARVVGWVHEDASKRAILALD